MKKVEREKKKRTEPRLVLMVTPEFTQNGILGARIFAKHKTC